MEGQPTKIDSDIQVKSWPKLKRARCRLPKNRTCIRREVEGRSFQEPSSLETYQSRSDKSIMKCGVIRAQSPMTDQRATLVTALIIALETADNNGLSKLRERAKSD